MNRPITNSTKPRFLVNYVLIFLGTLLIYGLCCAPGYLWQDSGLIQYRTLNKDITGPFGLALSHPLYYLLTIGLTQCLPQAFPHGVNLISSFFAALTVANVYLLVCIWTNAKLPALIASLTLAFSHTFWRNACIAETYSLWVCLFSFELLFLLFYIRLNNAKYLHGLAAFNGLALSTHILAIIPLACYMGYFTWLCKNRKVKPTSLITILISWLVASSPYLDLIIQYAFKGNDVTASIQSALFGSNWQDEVLSLTITGRLFKTSLLYFILNFPTLNACLFVLPLIHMIRRKDQKDPFSIMVWLMALLFYIFALRYEVPDRYVFFVPFYFIISMFIGIGAHILCQSSRFKHIKTFVFICSLLPIIAYAMVPSTAKQQKIHLNTRADVPYRNDYTYFLQPWKTGYHGAERFAREALTQADHNALICADMTTASPLLLLQQQEDLRPDVQIANPVLGIKINWQAPSQIDQILKKQVIYVVSRKPGYCPASLLDYPMQQKGILWQVLPKGHPLNHQG